MFKDNPGKADLLLLLIFIIYCAVVILRVHVEATGYLSPDSRAYLGLAQSLAEGNGFYILNEEDGTGRFFSTWPVGYPVLIYIVIIVTGLSAFWASKALNLFILGCSFLLLRKIYQPYAFVLASVYGAYTFLEVYSFTWSEAPFLLGITLLAYSTSHAIKEPQATSYVVYIFATCLFLFLMRYVGAFSFSIPALFSLYFFYTRDYRAGTLYSINTVLLAVLASVYVYINYSLSGHITGIERFEAPTESAGDFLLMLLQGICNEFFIMRKFRAASQPDYLFYATTAIQIAVLIYVYRPLKSVGSFVSAMQYNTFATICFVIAGLYFAALLTLRLISHFDDLDYRLLSPVSLLTIIGLVYTVVTLPETTRSLRHVKYVIFAFFIASLLLNLPKEHLLSQLKSLLVFVYKIA